MIARTVALLLSLTLCLGIGLGTASACTCERAPINVRGFAAQKAWEFARAPNVVRGRIVSVRAGEGVVRQGVGVVLFTMRIHTVLKGDVPTGDVTIVTSADGGRCGMGGHLLGAAEGGQDMSLELGMGELPGEFRATLCGYFLFGPDPNLSQGR